MNIEWVEIDIDGLSEGLIQIHHQPPCVPPQTPY
jgi:hypothetical protein